MNSKLKCRGIVVSDLYEDLKSGIVLYNFLEVRTPHANSTERSAQVLTGESLKRFGKLNNGRLRIQQVANQNVVFAFFPEADIKLENIGVMDVVDGRPTPVLGLIWSIIAFYLVKELGESGDDLAAVKRKILRWCKKHAQKKVPVNNLTESFSDGKAFLAILNDIDNAGSPYRPSEDAVSNFKTAFADAEDKYGLPQMLDPENERLWEDEISMLTYLATMMDMLPESVSQPDPASLVDNWLDQRADEIADDLARLCACRSTEGDASGRADARAVVDEMIGKAELDAAASDAECAVGAWKIDDSCPTVLIYCATSVDDAPVELFEPKRIEEGRRLLARGAKADKANVVAALYAARALKQVLTGGETTPLPPCNVTVVVGGRTPNALASLPPDLKHADYVLVSEPPDLNSASFSAVSPAARSALLYGCRGFVEFTVACTLSSDMRTQQPTALAAERVGPLIDPAVALASKLAALRDRESAAPTDASAVIAGLPSLPLDLVDFAPGGPPVAKDVLVAAAKKQVNYLETAMAAPEFGASKPPLAALALDPALIVKRIWTEGEPLSLPRRALATIWCALPPGYDDLEAAAKKVKDALCVETAGFGFELLQVGNVVGKSGYISDSRQPMARVIIDALSAGSDEAVVGFSADPTYAHIAARFANVFPDAAVFQIAGLPREDSPDSVNLADLTAWTKKLARLLHAAAVPKKAPKLKPYSLERVVEAAPVTTDSIKTTVVAVNSADTAYPAKPPPPPPLDQPEQETQSPDQAHPSTTSHVPPQDTAQPQTAEATLDALCTQPSEDAQAGKEIAAAADGFLSPGEGANEPAESSPMGPSIPTVEEEIAAPKLSGPLTTSALVDELNRLRANPKGYIEILEELLPLYRDDKSFWPREAKAQPFMTHEGKAAVEEAVAYLEKTDFGALRPLTLHEGMSKAAAEHADDLVNSGERLGHTGSDGSKPADRLSRHGRWFERASECLAYRHLSACALVAQLIIDDGMPSRTQRNTALSAEMRAVGAAVREHPSHGVLAVLTFAGGYGPQPLEVEAHVEASQSPPSAEFKAVLDSIPVVAVHEQVEQALARMDKVELDYKPGALKMTIWSAGQCFGIRRPSNFSLCRRRWSDVRCRVGKRMRSCQIALDSDLRLD